MAAVRHGQLSRDRVTLFGSEKLDGIELPRLRCTNGRLRNAGGTTVQQGVARCIKVLQNNLK